jgi:hypothetical protein
MKNTRSDQFYTELIAFRNKWPCCYLEAWTPNDFHAVSKACKKTSTPQKDQPAWEAWEKTAKKLYDTFDPNVGTFLDRLQWNINN